MNERPLPVVPDYAGANVRGIVPALLGAPASRRAVPLPDWFPTTLGAARQVVLLVIDGLGWEQLVDRAAVAPTLASMAGGPITTVAPSTTATALTSISTGLTPGEHGLVGYRMEVSGEVLNVLRWHTSRGDARRSLLPTEVQPFEPFLGERVGLVGRVEFETSAFSQAHLRGAVLRGYRVMSSLPVQVRWWLSSGEHFIHAYYDGIDKVAHEHGFGPFYDAELRAVDRLVADLIDVLPRGGALIVVADHGQVHVGENIVRLESDLQRMCRGMSGEGRFRWLHARPGAVDELLSAARERHGHEAWVHDRRELVAQGWFGPVVSPPVAARYGDVALVPFADISFHDPDDSGPLPLVCRHGSLTSAEMLVPLLAAVNDS